MEISIRGGGVKPVPHFFLSPQFIQKCIKKIFYEGGVPPKKNPRVPPLDILGIFSKFKKKSPIMVYYWKTRSKRPIDAKLWNILTSLKCVQYQNISLLLVAHLPVGLPNIWSIKFTLNIFTYLCFENLILNIDILCYYVNLILSHTISILYL